MKKILSFFLAAFIVNNSFGQIVQTRPSGTIYQGVGNTNTWYQIGGTGYSVLGFVNSAWADTASMNLHSFLKTIPGVQVRTGNRYWVRSDDATKWNEVAFIGASGVGTVTSVGLSLPSIFTVSGSPVTGAGTLTGTLASQLQNLVFASPNGSSGTPTFRAIVAGDLPGTSPYTWQQTLTAGSTLTGNNTIAGGGFDWTWNSLGSMRLNGNVGIGVAPTYKLQVLGSTKFDVGADSFFVTGTTSSPVIFQRQATALAVRGVLQLQWKQTDNVPLVPSQGPGLHFTLKDYADNVRDLGNIAFLRGTNDSSSKYFLYVYKNGVYNHGMIMDEDAHVGISNTAPVALLTLGTAGTTLGSISVSGNTSGIITMNPQAAAGTYNWNWPTTAGTANQVLTSQGGVGTAMTWETPSTVATAVPINGLTAATGANTIDNGNFAQEWDWNTLGANQGLTLSSTSTAAASNSQILLNVGLSGANSTSTQTTYAAQIANTHSGTSSTNVAANFSAVNGTNNYAILVPAGNGDVGIGVNPTSKLHVVPVQTTGVGVNFASSTTTTGTVLNIAGTSTVLAAGNEALNIAVSGANGTNAITATGARISVTNTNATSGTNVGLDLTASGATTANNALNIAAGAIALNGSVGISGQVITSSAGGLNTWSTPTTGTVTGTGTTNYVSKWTSSTAQGNSQIFDNGTSIGFGTASPVVKFDFVGGDAQFGGGMRAKGYDFTGATGPGIEFGYDGTKGQIGAYDRTGGSFKAIDLFGSYMSFSPNQTEVMRVNSTGLAVGTTSNSASALLHVASTTQGVLLAPMTNAQFAAISSPATGLQVYSTDALMSLQYNGSAYKSVGVVSGTYNSGAVVAQATFTVTFGGTQPNTTYKVSIAPDNVLSAALYYVQNRTTTTFDVVYLSGLTGTVSFDFLISQ